MKNFNQLTMAEAERLAYLLEELGEAQQAIGKILRHGYNSKNPDIEHHSGNRWDLIRELADINKAITMLVENGDINGDTLRELAKAPAKITYFHHQS